jgi:hypothetical protein
MEKIIEFVGNNYVWFLTITILLIFALIGYIYDSKRDKEDLLKKSEDNINEEMLENLDIPEGKSLADTVNAAKNINSETKTVEMLDQNILNSNDENNSQNIN